MTIATETIIQKKKRRGFAAMSPDQLRAITSKGGKTAHAMGKAHTWTSEEASIAGRKGGTISRKRGPNRGRRREQLV